MDRFIVQLKTLLPRQFKLLKSSMDRFIENQDKYSTGALKILKFSMDRFIVANAVYKDFLKSF